MTPKHSMNFESLKQIFKFEVSRFPFMAGERQKSLRRAYRALEASLRDSVRALELGWGEALSQRALSARLEEITGRLRDVCTEYGGILAPEMRNGLENLCEHLRKLREAVHSSSQERGPAFQEMSRELAQGLEELKKALGTVHRL